MTLLEQREAIVAALKAALPQIGLNIRSHGGRFTPEEIRRYAVNTPALLVACLGLASITDNDDGTVTAVPVWGVFVVATDKPQLPRDAGALVLVSAATPVIAGNRWGLDSADYPDQLRGDNLYSGTIDGAGVALWAISWRQSITLAEFDPSALEDFLRCHVEYDLVPTGTIDATDDITLPT